MIKLIIITFISIGTYTYHMLGCVFFQLSQNKGYDIQPSCIQCLWKGTLCTSFERSNLPLFGKDGGFFLEIQGYKTIDWSSVDRNSALIPRWLCKQRKAKKNLLIFFITKWAKNEKKVENASNTFKIWLYEITFTFIMRCPS